MLKSLIRILFLVLLSGFLLSSTTAFLPVTAGAGNDSSSQLPLDSLDSFTAKLSNGKARQIVGAYAADIFALPVVQQPISNPAYVSTEAEKATQFSMAQQYGSIGLVAHNNLAGKHFFDLAAGDQLTLIYGDGTQVDYTICEIRHYQALSPSNPYSQYLNLDHPDGIRMDVDAVFKEVYAVKDRLVLQTCIANGKVDSWGRLFVIAAQTATGCQATETAK